MESISVFVRENTKIRCRFPYGAHPARFYSCERWTVLSDTCSVGMWTVRVRSILWWTNGFHLQYSCKVCVMEKRWKFCH